MSHQQGGSKNPNAMSDLNEYLSNEDRNSQERNDRDDFDVEMQEYTPQPFKRPTASYIPEYIGTSNQFPIQEVVPNTNIPIHQLMENHSAAQSPNRPSSPVNNSNMNNLSGDMSTAAATSVNVNTTSNTDHLRARDHTTVSANVLNLGHLYKNNYGNNNDDGDHISVQEGVTNDSESKQYGTRRDRATSFISRLAGGGDDGSPNDPNPGNASVPIIVKPKTLYQNPQTPTVLPSTYHPINRWSLVKSGVLKEFLAEFMGTMVMIIFGFAVVIQVLSGGKAQQDSYLAAMDALSQSDLSAGEKMAFENLTKLVSSVSAGTFDDIALGWAAAVVMGYFCAGGSAISGGHLNPIITLANFVYRGFPAKKIPFYFFGQLFGAYVGGLIAYGYYKKVISETFPDHFNSETVVSMFCVVPKPYLSSARQFVSEFLCGAMLVACTFALTDPYTSLSGDVFPLMLFLLIFMCNSGLGYQTGTAMNMARDLGPRMALYTVGFSRKLLWTSHHHFFWVPICAPFIGALTGGLVYDIFIYQGHESPVNWPFSLYKETFQRWWFKRPGWQRRNKARRMSDLSEISYAEDEDLDNTYTGTRFPRVTKTKSYHSSHNTDEKKVQFKSVQRDKPHNQNMAAVLDDESSLETASLGDSYIEQYSSKNSN